MGWAQRLPEGKGTVKLTERQAEFVRQYLVDLNGKQAAIRAGYSERSAEVTASRLLRQAKVAEAIEKATQKRAERVQVTVDDVIRGLLVEARGEGPDTSASARSRAWELLGKHLSMFVDRHEHLLKRIDQMTEAELVALVGEDATAEHVH